MQNIKLVVLGAGGVGKTSIVKSYAKNYNPDDNMSFAVIPWRYKRPIRLEICDSAGQNDYERLSSFCFHNTNVFLFCFSIVDPDSFENILTSWYPRVRYFCRNFSVILVGTKVELRNDKDQIDMLKKKHQSPISFQQGKYLADKIGAYKYLEFSVLMTEERINKIFDTALLSVVCDIDDTD